MRKSVLAVCFALEFAALLALLWCALVWNAYHWHASNGAR